MELSLELGASCPVVIRPDADIELASSAVARGGSPTVSLAIGVTASLARTWSTGFFGVDGGLTAQVVAC
jgi:hypothetical protein